MVTSRSINIQYLSPTFMVIPEMFLLEKILNIKTIFKTDLSMRTLGNVVSYYLLYEIIIINYMCLIYQDQYKICMVYIITM